MDLHTLWYVLLRERNLLVTQSHEARRTGINLSVLGSSTLREYKVRTYTHYRLSWSSAHVASRLSVPQEHGPHQVRDQ